VVKKVKAP
jgi:hypothetical protein